MKGQEQYSRRTSLRFHNVSVPVDPNGRIIHPVDPSGRIIHRVDPNGRMIHPVDPNGRIVDPVDPNGRIIHPVDPNGRIIHYVHHAPLIGGTKNWEGKVKLEYAIIVRRHCMIK